MPTTGERRQASAATRRKHWRIAALVAAAILLLGLRLYTAHWAGDLTIVRAVAALRRIQIDYTAPASRFFYFTSSVEPNFLCLGTAPPDAAVPGAQFWILHRDRLAAIDRPADFKPSPNWLDQATTGAAARQTVHDPRRGCDFDFTFSGYHARRPVLALFHAPPGSRRWLNSVDSYTGKRRLAVRRTGAPLPSVLLERQEWNVSSPTPLASVAHYDQAFGILVVPTRIEGQTFLLVLDANDLN